MHLVVIYENWQARDRELPRKQECRILHIRCKAEVGQPTMADGTFGCRALDLSRRRLDLGGPER